MEKFTVEKIVVGGLFCLSVVLSNAQAITIPLLNASASYEEGKTAKWNSDEVIILSKNQYDTLINDALAVSEDMYKTVRIQASTIEKLKQSCK